MSNHCGACGQPRDAWETVKKAVAVMCERAEHPRRRPPTGALKFMQRLAVEGGRIVSTASLTPEQVIEARESNRLFVTGEGLGFVIFPAGVIGPVHQTKADHTPSDGQESGGGKVPWIGDPQEPPMEPQCCGGKPGCDALEYCAAASVGQAAPDGGEGKTNG